MGHSVNTLYNLGEKIFLVDLAKKEGKLVGGNIEEIRIVIVPGGPHVYYKMTNNDAIYPPEGLYREDQICSLNEAREFAAKRMKHLSDVYLRSSASVLYQGEG